MPGQRPNSPRSPRSPQPLAGRRVLVTRAAPQARELGDLLHAEGAKAIVLPVIRIADPPDWAPVARALAQLDSYDWLVFSSSNGVRAVVGRLDRIEGDHARLGRIRVAAVGPGTAAELKQAGAAELLLPEDYCAEGLLATLVPEAAGRRFLLARADRGRETLAAGLRAAGAVVDQIVVYSSIDATPTEPEVGAVAEQLRQRQIDWVTITSSAIARAVVRLFGELLHKTRLASISPITSGTLEELGFSPAVEAEPHTLPGLVAAIKRGEG